MRPSGKPTRSFVPAVGRDCLMNLLKPLTKSISVFMEPNSGTGIAIPGRNCRYGFNALVKITLNAYGLILIMTGKAMRYKTLRCFFDCLKNYDFWFHSKNMYFFVWNINLPPLDPRSTHSFFSTHRKINSCKTFQRRTLKWNELPSIKWWTDDELAVEEPLEIPGHDKQLLPASCLQKRCRLTAR